MPAGRPFHKDNEEIKDNLAKRLRTNSMRYYKRRTFRCDTCNREYYEAYRKKHERKEIHKKNSQLV